MSLQNIVLTLTWRNKFNNCYISHQNIHKFNTSVKSTHESRPVASQPGGGSELGWVEHQAHPPPLGHCPCDIINLKKRPHSWTFTSTPPPLDIARVTSSTYSKGGTKLLKGGTKIAKGWNKIAERWNKIAKGWNKIAKGWNKIAERWNKIAKGWKKIAKGWNKNLWDGQLGGVVRPPRPPPPPLATGL